MGHWSLARRGQIRTIGGMDSFFGVPAHPLLVHIPAVLLPLAAIGVVMMLIKKSWFEQYKWVVLAITGVGAVGCMLAAGAGESLQAHVIATEGVQAAAKFHEHTEKGDTAQVFAIIFFVVVLAAVLVPILLERRAKGDAAKASPTWLRPVTVALLLLSAGASLVTVIDAGHSGAKSVWVDVEGGEKPAP
jgi:hypothetical protein